jgi:hypothetical protein
MSKKLVIGEPANLQRMSGTETAGKFEGKSVEQSPGQPTIGQTSNSGSTPAAVDKTTLEPRKVAATATGFAGIIGTAQASGLKSIGPGGLLSAFDNEAAKMMYVTRAMTAIENIKGAMKSKGINDAKMPNLAQFILNNRPKQDEEFVLIDTSDSWRKDGSDHDQIEGSAGKHIDYNKGGKNKLAGPLTGSISAYEQKFNEAFRKDAMGLGLDNETIEALRPNTQFITNNIVTKPPQSPIFTSTSNLPPPPSLPPQSHQQPLAGNSPSISPNPTTPPPTATSIAPNSTTPSSPPPLPQSLKEATSTLTPPTNKPPTLLESPSTKLNEQPPSPPMFDQDSIDRVKKAFDSKDGSNVEKLKAGLEAIEAEINSLVANFPMSSHSSHYINISNQELKRSLYELTLPKKDLSGLITPAEGCTGDEFSKHLQEIKENVNRGIELSSSDQKGEWKAWTTDTPWVKVAILDLEKNNVGDDETRKAAVNTVLSSINCMDDSAKKEMMKTYVNDRRLTLDSMIAAYIPITIKKVLSPYRFDILSNAEKLQVLQAMNNGIRKTIGETGRHNDPTSGGGDRVFGFIAFRSSMEDTETIKKYTDGFHTEMAKKGAPTKKDELEYAREGYKQYIK